MRSRLLVLVLLPMLGLAARADTVALLRSGDLMEMKLSGMPQEFAADFNLQYTVSSDGNINVPLIGKMKALGLTPQQLEEAVQSKLVSEQIFTRPTVIINIQQNARYVSIGGGVRQPQRMQWAPDLTLMSAVQIAGGVSDFGTLKDLKLIRDSKVQIFDGRKFEKDPSQDPKLLPGDQIVVKQ